jgi:hypothetical protein
MYCPSEQYGDAIAKIIAKAVKSHEDSALTFRQESVYSTIAIFAGSFAYMVADGVDLHTAKQDVLANIRTICPKVEQVAA